MALTPLITFKKLETPLSSKKCEVAATFLTTVTCTKEATILASNVNGATFLLCDRDAERLKAYRFGPLYKYDDETQAAYSERLENRAWLLGILKPGDTVYSVLRHVSSSGMYRAIDFYKFTCEDGEIGRRWLSRPIASLLQEKFDEKREAVGVSGCGMDMGFHVVYSLSRALWPHGFECIDLQPDGHSRRCPSNDHMNAYAIKQGGGTVPTHHNDGGYALKSEWIG